MIDETCVVEIARAARARWMVENECFNILKNHGYSIDHSYGHGHGQKNLSFNFYTLIILAFTLHQIHELTDKLFQQAPVFRGPSVSFGMDYNFCLI
jgi:hypothetical protein